MLEIPLWLLVTAAVVAWGKWIHMIRKDAKAQREYNDAVRQVTR